MGPRRRSAGSTRRGRARNVPRRGRPRFAAADSPGVVDIVPAARTVLVRCADRASSAGLTSWLADLDASAEPWVDRLRAATRWSRSRSRYDGEDLDDVARATGLDRDEVIARHTGSTFRVAFCGFAPGFAYLRGLDAGTVAARGDRRHGPGYPPDRSRSPPVLGGLSRRVARRMASPRHHLDPGAGTPIAHRRRCSSRAPRSGSSPHDGSSDRDRRRRLVDDDPGSRPTRPRPPRRADGGRRRPGARRARQPSGRQRRARGGARDGRRPRRARHRAGPRSRRPPSWRPAF